MGLKFDSTVNDEVVHWNLTFGYDNAVWDEQFNDVRDLTYAYLKVVNPEVDVDNPDYVVAQYEAVVIRRPSEQFNKESARIYAILAVLEQAGVVLHDEKSEFFEAYREAKRNSGKSNKQFDVYVSK